MSKNNFGQWLTQSHVGRILLLGLLIILLKIPVSSIEGLVFERQSTQQAAVSEIQDKWGREQRVIGPLLVVPYQVKRVWQDAHSGVKETQIDTNHAVFLPDSLEASSELASETRYRGIFEVPLYQSKIHLSGRFARPDFRKWDIDEGNILWDKARLIVMVSDARAIQKQATVNWNGEEYYFSPGTGDVTGNSKGYHVSVAGFKGKMNEYRFSIRLQLNGSKGMYFAPLGKDSLVKINAPWPDPSFQGNWLPTAREVSDAGFSATWQIPYLGRNFPQQTRNFSDVQNNIQASLVGVELISPVDNYRMAERSIKYVSLFLLLTFVVIWLIEVLANLRVHFLQYMFIGAALCIFYLLELSLSEHLGFYWAYAIATVAIVGMVSSYSYVVLRTGKRAAIISGSLAGLYLYLFTLLQEQNYALLVGSIGLFVILGVVMYVTRHIDWFKLTQMPALKTETAEKI